MSIEIARNSEASTARSGAANGRAGAANAQDGPGGFMLALSAVDGAASEAGVTDGAAGDPARSDEQESPANPSLSSAEASNSVPAVLPDPAPAVPGVDNAMLFAQSALVARDGASALSGGQATDSSSRPRPGAAAAVAAIGTTAFGADGASLTGAAGGSASAPAAGAAKATASATTTAGAATASAAAPAVDGDLAANPPVQAAGSDTAPATGDERFLLTGQEPSVATLASGPGEAESAKRSLPAAANAAAVAANANLPDAAIEPLQAPLELSAAPGGKQAPSRAQPGVDGARGLSTLAFSQPHSPAAQRLAAQAEALRAPLQEPAQASGWAIASETLVLQAAQAGPLARREDRIGERSTGTAFTQVGAASGSTAPEASAFMLPVDAASGGTAAGQASLAERMVDQVSYWMSQKIQGAEIKLDGAGGQAVSVSVQIKGNEAQVAFRSDQPEVRQMLTQSMPQLEKMLGSEGLMLSGATVGGHAEGGADGKSGARESPPALRMSGVPNGATGLPEAPRAAPQAPLGRSGRSLDLYV